MIPADSADSLFESGYLLLGIVTFLIGLLLPADLFMPGSSKWQVTEPAKYLFAGRMIFYLTGVFWVVFSIAAFLIQHLASSKILRNLPLQVFAILFPVLLAFFITSYQKKYLKKNG